MRWVIATLGLLLFVPPASAQPVDFSQQVEQVHLAWDRQEYWVAFLHPLVLDPTRTPISVTYTTEDGKVHAGEWFRGPNAVGGKQIYHFRMDSNTTHYTIGPRGYDIRPAPKPGDPVRVAFLSDVGQTPDTRALLAQVVKANVSMILIGGDLSYADGDEALWDSWFTMMEPIASVIPVQPARGNHEARCLPKAGVNGLDCTTDERVYRQRFFPEEDLLFYGFEWGAGRFYSLDSEAYFPRTTSDPSQIVYNTDPEEQKAFLRDRLAGNEHAWEVVYFHRPVYSSNGAHGSELDVRDDLVPVLDEGKADLVLNAHDHDYERMWPMRDGRIVETTDSVTKGSGTVYMVSGGGGESLYEAWAPTPDWSARHESNYNFLLLDLTDDGLNVTALDQDGVAFDHVEIVRREVDTQTDKDEGRASAIGVVTSFVVLAVVLLARRR